MHTLPKGVYIKHLPKEGFSLSINIMITFYILDRKNSISTLHISFELSY